LVVYEKSQERGADGRWTGRGAPGGSGEPGHGGPEEVEEVVLIADALEITVTWVG
jgi:hypothetical protein